LSKDERERAYRKHLTNKEQYVTKLAYRNLLFSKLQAQLPDKRRRYYFVLVVWLDDVDDYECNQSYQAQKTNRC
jgi:hypothetical protein